jgi:hypothetical protein
MTPSKFIAATLKFSQRLQMEDRTGASGSRGARMPTHVMAA